MKRLVLKEGPLNEPGSVEEIVGGALSNVLAGYIHENSDVIEDEAVDNLSRLGDNLPVPARYEDIQGFADSCTKVVLSRIEDEVHELAFMIVQRMMKPE